jgi:hypothetical protein
VWVGCRPCEGGSTQHGEAVRDDAPHKEPAGEVGGADAPHEGPAGGVEEAYYEHNNVQDKAADNEVPDEDPADGATDGGGT